ncbi:hypothetical protein [Candidatus Leptofilum sp.]|uniref:hypothetical protein n=1 Tax=Candidatus Leptofilum sp. TaxID=3241576 RepID=UPI003B5CAA1F
MPDIKTTPLIFDDPTVHIDPGAKSIDGLISHAKYQVGHCLLQFNVKAEMIDVIREFIGDAEQPWFFIDEGIKAGQRFVKIWRDDRLADLEVGKNLANNFVHFGFELPYEADEQPFSIELDIDPSINDGIQHVYSFYIKLKNTISVGNNFLELNGGTTNVQGEMFLGKDETSEGEIIDAIKKINALNENDNRWSTTDENENAPTFIDRVDATEVQQLTYKLADYRIDDEPIELWQNKKKHRWQLDTVEKEDQVETTAYVLVVTGSSDTGEESKYSVKGLIEVR